jgi:signal transduction histidine kinase
MVRISGIKSKLLLAFVTVLLIITVLNVGLAIYLTNQQSQREAFTSLTRQTILLQNDLEKATIDFRAVAEKTAGGTDNLSDLATLYIQTIQITANPEQAQVNERGLAFNKVISLNRLDVVLHSAGFSSAAVYIEDQLSHYVTTVDVGMSIVRNNEKMLIGTIHDQDENLGFNNWPNWMENDLSPLITARIPQVNHPTISFDFVTEQMVVLQIIVPIQAVTQTVMRSNITLGYAEGLLVDDLSIATPETLNRSMPGQNKPIIIGAFVFKKVFDRAFLEEVAQKTGLLPALYSPDGVHQVQIVDMKIAPADLARWVQENKAEGGQYIWQGPLLLDREAYYQALTLWQFDGEPRLIIGFAQSGASAAQKVRETVAGLIIIAGLVLIIGGLVGYALFDRLVTPIVVLTDAVSRIDLSAQIEGPVPKHSPTFSDKLVEIDLQARDEVGQLTAAFNAMIRQLRQSFETLEERVSERTAELEAANKELEAFTYSVSHDLRAPLRHIDGFIEMLKRRTSTSLDEQSQHYMENVSDAARRMGALIEDLLAFSRMGRRELSRIPVDINGILQEVLEEFTLETEGREIEWKLTPLPIVMGDPAMLRAVLANLISNALKFTGSRDVALIEIGCEKKDDAGVVIFVRDNGVGFDMAYADKLFGVFQRLHRAEDFEGTGIGLANVRRIINRHGGRVWAEGQIDQGATFYFSLPAYPQGG